jgi:hypothetical protein
MTLLDPPKKDFFKTPDAPGREVTTATTLRKRARFTHQIWTRADGFTLSGTKRS